MIWRRDPKGINRVNFLGCAVEAMTVEGEGQPKLRAFTAHRED